MSTIDDLALAFQDSVPVMEFDHGVKIYKYKLSKGKFGYYVATQPMTKEEWESNGCVYPKQDRKGRITAMVDAINYAKDRVFWVNKFIGMKNGPVNNIVVLNGPIAIS